MLRGALAALCVLSGCGAIVEHSVPADASPDADPHGPVSVTVLDVIGNGAPAPNIPVIFIDPDGTIAADVVSDADGRATATVLPGASVSAVYQKIAMSSSFDPTSMVTTNTTTTTYTAVTILEIKPGDDLPIGFTDRDTTQSGTFAVTFTPFPNATAHTIVTPCGASSGGTAGSATVTMQKSCQRDTFDVLVLASDASGMRAGAAASNVALSAGSVKVPNQYTSAGSFATSYSDVPSDLTRISMERISGINDNGFANFASCTPSAGACAINLNSVPTVGAKSIVATTFVRGTGAAQVSQVHAQRVGGNNLNYALDVGTNLLPWMSTATLDQTTATTTPVLDAPDMVSDVYGSEIVFSRSTSSTTGNVVTVLETDVDRFALGPTVEPIKFPILPPHVGPIDYQPTDTGFDLVAVRSESSKVNGWDEARPRAFDLVDAFQKFSTDDDIVRGQLLFAPFPDPVGSFAKTTGSTRSTRIAPQLARPR